MKRILFFLIIAAMVPLLFVGAVWYLNEGFSLSNISSNIPYSSQWNVTHDLSQDQVLGYLNQNFYYMGKGSQCYVFESEDKQTVLKFFRHSRYRVPKIYNFTGTPAFVLAIQNKKREEKEKKLKALFESCKIAYNELRSESGLLYLHLNPSRDLKKNITIYDKLKRPYSINVDDYTFVLQKQGEQILPYFSRLLKKGKKTEVEKGLDDLTQLIATRLCKGIADSDAVIHKNSGFQGNRAFFIDIGTFEKKATRLSYEEMKDVTAFLQSWFQKEDPELASYLDKLLSSYITQELIL